MNFTFVKLNDDGVYKIKSKRFIDERGFFSEFYKSSDFIKSGISENFCQDNFSLSGKGVIRGLHYQNKPHSQGKLITVLNGSIFDYIINIDPLSKNYKKSLIFEMSFNQSEMIYIPPNYAHGFQSLEDNTLVFYKCTKEFNKSRDSGINPLDSYLDIKWPISDYKISSKDSDLPFFDEVLQK